MPFRFRRSVKIAPGLRLSFGKKSASLRLGVALVGFAFFLGSPLVRFAAIAAAGLVILTAGYDLNRATELTATAGDNLFAASIGPGLPVVLVGAIAAGVAALFARSRREA